MAINENRKLEVYEDDVGKWHVIDDEGAIGFPVDSRAEAEASLKKIREDLMVLARERDAR